MDQNEGKGVEVASKSMKTRFLCHHRYALVSRRLVGTSSKAKNPGPRYSPAVFLLQTCRRCGIFRSSVFVWCWDESEVFVTRQVRLLPAGEGDDTDIFNLEKGRRYAKGYLPASQLMSKPISADSKILWTNSLADD